MSEVYFRSKKYNLEFNCFFFLFDGERIEAFSTTPHIGETVRIMVDVKPEQAEIINDREQTTHIRAHNPHAPIGKRAADCPGEWSAMLEFQVVDVHHTYAVPRPGRLQAVNKSICLEAIDGHHEDLFLWLMMSQPPAWVKEYERYEEEVQKSQEGSEGA